MLWMVYLRDWTYFFLPIYMLLVSQPFLFAADFKVVLYIGTMT